MPGRLNFISQKLKSYNSAEKDDLTSETNSNSIILDAEEAEMSEADCKNNWFKTWPERDYDKLYQNIDSPTSKDENQILKKFDSVESQVPLNKLLEEIALAYSPVTKQLHVLTTKEQQKNLSDDSYKSPSKSEVIENSDEEIEQFRTKPSHINLSDKTVDNQKEKLWNSKVGYSNQKCDNCDKSKGDQCNLHTEANSFSSIISSLSDNSFSNFDENGSGNFSFLESDDLSIRSHYSQDSGSTYGENSKFFESRGTWNKEDSKKKGISGFFSRNVFAWKPATPITSQGWKLFGKTLGQETESSRLSNAAEIDSQHSASNSPLSVKKYEDVIASSSALILHNRPANLPAKSMDEQQKHKLEYEQIVEAARRKEVKESKKRKKQLQQQLKFEEQLSNASKIWNNEILPKWNSVKNSRKVRELWWAGIPPSVRGKIWKLAIGNELNITYQLYDICAARAQERLKNVETNSQDDCPGNDKESSVELIQLDISRTFPQLCIFQKGGPYYDILHCLLGAYVCYRPDVGYVQGMSFIAAVLILNLEPADAFISFANLLNRSCHMAFFSLNQSLMLAYYDTYNIFFKENLPKLSQHFQESSLTPDLYLLDWVYSVFAKAMPLDLACRIWDVFLRDGEEFLFRTALGVLHLHQDKLLKLDFISGAQFLTKLPEDLSADLLFKSIESIKMCIGKLKFSQVLFDCNEKYSSR